MSWSEWSFSRWLGPLKVMCCWYPMTVIGAPSTSLLVDLVSLQAVVEWASSMELVLRLILLDKTNRTRSKTDEVFLLSELISLGSDALFNISHVLIAFGSLTRSSIEHPPDKSNDRIDICSFSTVPSQTDLHGHTGFPDWVLIPQLLTRQQLCFPLIDCRDLKLE